MELRLYNAKWERYKLPMTINFLRKVSDNSPVPLGELTDTQIKKLGKAITDEMLSKAAKQRKTT